jgi:hypothetical protein
VTEHEEDEDFSYLWLGSWKLHAVIVVFFTISLIKPLSSSAPLIAIYFPGLFIVASGWSILRYAKAWSPVRQPVRTHAPAALYAAVATATLFVAHAATGRGAYRTAALGSLWLTVPVVVLTALVIIFRRPISERIAKDRPA